MLSEIAGTPIRLDRRDRDGHYEPGNCEWATRTQQNRNTNRNTHLTARGETRLLVEWAEVTGLPTSAIHARLARGWSVEDAIFKPARRRNSGRTLEQSTRAIYYAMKHRCQKPTCRSYPDYGGRGIRVCERWNASYAAFLLDMGTRPSFEHTLDRIDNDGDYSSKNCRWATRSEQSGNRRSAHLVSCNGRTETLAEWSRITGLNRATIAKRLEFGWPVEEAIGLKNRPRPKSRPQSLISRKGKPL